LKRKRVGLKCVDKGVIRAGTTLHSSSDDREIGYVTSGTMSPSLKQSIAMAYVVKELTAKDTQLYAINRNRKI